MGRKRGRWLVQVALISGLALIAGVATAFTLINDTGTYSVEVPDYTTSVENLTLDEAPDDGDADGIVSYFGDHDQTSGSSGTGVFDPFVRLQAEPTESGYNTDDNTPEFDSKTGKWTKAIKLSQIPTVEFNGQLYWEIFADINDDNNNPLISLDDVELYLTTTPDDAVVYPFTGFATKVYDFDGTIKINDVNQGSGRGDLRYLFPQDDNVPPDCTYGNPACTTYLILYSAWGGDGTTYGSDGGFEEWKVKKYVILNGVKYKDVNADGDRDTGEPGLSGWTINIYADEDGDGVLDASEFSAGPVISITTPSSGFYSYTVLDPGDYIVCEVGTTNWAQTQPTNTICAAESGDASGGYAWTVESGGFGALTGNFGNTPLSNFDVNFYDLTGSTDATISCTGPGGPYSSGAENESGTPEKTLTANGVRIGTYTCTITITDP